MNIPDDDCLARYLAGEATTGEQEKVAVWLKQDPKNARKMGLLQDDLEFIASNYREDAFNVDTAWQNFADSHMVSPRHRWRQLYRYGAAAAVVLLAGAAIWVYVGKEKAPEWVSVRTGENEQRKIVLPDSSIVTLASSTMISYSTDRQIKLDGKAFFEITQAPHRPFSVSTQQLEVTVLGTSFLVDEQDDSTKVIVSSGKVRVKENKGGDNVTLTAGNEATYRSAPGSLLKSETMDANWLSWQTGVLVFKNTPVKEVLAKLGERYHVRLRLKDVPPVVADKWSVSAEFGQISLDQAVKILEDILGVKLEKERIK
ncbi:MAG TPA: FecR domain-containing protein [Chitinophaga sp.]|nr:FecR domain-containing protein [Chitinophaga sp.]